MTHDEWLAAKTAGERDRKERRRRFAEVMAPYMREMEDYISRNSCTCPRFSDGVKVFPQRQCEWCKENGQ